MMSPYRTEILTPGLLMTLEELMNHDALMNQQ